MAYTKVDYPEIKCEWCSEFFKPNRSDKKFCSQSCYRRHGKKYKGHSRGNKETLRKHKKKYLKVKRRPYIVHKQSVCCFCGFVPVHECQLDVDHIDGNHENNDPANLQTLCANCHRLKTAIQLGWLKCENPT